jgi:hypothetical protein
MSETLVPANNRPIACPNCGNFIRPGEASCSQCGTEFPGTDPVLTTLLSVSPLASPDVSAPVKEHRRQLYFEPTSSIILQFFPSGTYVSLTLDLSDFNAYRLGVSRQHCQLRRRGTNLIVTDFGSANGTFLNAEKLAAHAEYVIAHGDILTLGQLQIAVFFTNALS